MRPGKELKNIYIYIHISRRGFFKNQCNEICRLWDDKASKGRFFLSPTSSKFTVTKEKERRKRKSEEEERRRRGKSNGCTVSFYNSYFGERKMLDTKGPFSGNVFKNPTRLDSSSLFLFFFSFVSGDFRAYRARETCLLTPFHSNDCKFR